MVPSELQPTSPELPRWRLAVTSCCCSCAPSSAGLCGRCAVLREEGEGVQRCLVSLFEGLLEVTIVPVLSRLCHTWEVLEVLLRDMCFVFFTWPPLQLCQSAWVVAYQRFEEDCIWDD